MLKKTRMKGGVAMNITYTRKGEQMLPDLAISEEPIEVKGIWAIRRKNFLKEECRPVYYSMMTSGRLEAHLAKTQQEAEERMELLCQQMAEREHVTEEDVYKRQLYEYVKGLPDPPVNYRAYQIKVAGCQDILGLSLIHI